MKKIAIILLLLIGTLSANAAFRTYLCGITDITVDTLESVKKNQFIVTFNQKCKNTAEYGKPDTYYESTVKLYLNSDDRTLEGVYTTEGVDPYSTSHANDQTINMVYSEFTSGSTSRLLRRDTVSTFVITKIDTTHYAITECTLFFSQRVAQKDTWEYRYSYDANEILNEGIQQTPFVFTYEAGFRTTYTHYDMTIQGINIERHDSDYGTKRFLLMLACQGTNRANNQTINYELQLAIYPESEAINGTYSTQSGMLMYASNCYIKDLAANKLRYLESDSLSTIHIDSNGENQYIFRGETLLCTDVDMNHLAVYGEALITEVHYYHFDNNQSIAFQYDPNNRTIELSVRKVEMGSNEEGTLLTLQAFNNVANYTVELQLEGANMVGSFTTSRGLSLWSNIAHGTVYSYIQSGATLMIAQQADNTYVLSANLPCENGNTYVLNNIAFGDNTTTNTNHTISPTSDTRKVLRDGMLMIEHNGMHYSAQGQIVAL